MKKMLKKMVPAVLVSFLTSFMLFIYEPIITYTANVNDFWFDSKLMLPCTLFYFIGLFIFLLFMFSYVFFFSCTIKKEIVYRIVIAISFVIVVFAYIQGVYLVGNLPTLDGTMIEWDTYKKDKIISLVVFGVIAIAEIVGMIKFKTKKTIKVNCFIMGAIVIMLSTSLISSLTKPDFYKEKTIAVPTAENINNISTDKNFIILLADAVDSIEFSKIVDDDSIFEDFTYFPDTVSGYTFTRDSIPFIFSGVWNKNEMEFSDYSTKAFNESSILNKLKNQDYQLNIYEDEITWYSRKSEEIANMRIYNDQVSKKEFFKQLIKFIGYKYLPYQLKKYAHIETADFDLCQRNYETETYNWTNPSVYQNILENGLENIDQKYFQYIHIEGGHVPYNNNEDVEVIPEEEGTYDQKLKATAKVIDEYIKRLKESGAYDNSVIVVLADHGYWANGSGRQNPMLYIKGIDEHHEMSTSELPISYEDLSNAFVELADGKKSDELFSQVDVNRVRYFLDNGPGGEHSMPENEQRGKAWDMSTISETGTRYER